MSLDINQEYCISVYNAFVDSLLLGDKTPLSELDVALKNKKKSFQIKPNPTMTGLEESLCNPNADMRTASEILNDANKRDAEIATIPINNERNRRNPNRDTHLQLIKQTRQTIKRLKKDTQIWYGKRAYTPMSNAKHIAGFSLTGAFFFVAAMMAVDYFDPTAPSLTKNGLMFSFLIGSAAGAIGAVRYNNEYFQRRKMGLRIIKTALSPQ